MPPFYKRPGRFRTPFFGRRRSQMLALIKLYALCPTMASHWTWPIKRGQEKNACCRVLVRSVRCLEWRLWTAPSCRAWGTDGRFFAVFSSLERDVAIWKFCVKIPHCPTLNMRASKVKSQPPTFMAIKDWNPALSSEHAGVKKLKVSHQLLWR